MLVSASAVTLSGGAKYLYSLDGTNWKEISEIKGKDAKSYTVYWKIDGGTNYNDVTETQPLTVTIAPFNIRNSISSSIPYFKADYSVVPFDGTQKTLEPEFKLMASSDSDADTLATLVKGTDYTLSGNLSGTNIGSYSFTITAAGDNYTGSYVYYWNIVKGTAPTLADINVGAKCSDEDYGVVVQVDQLLRGMPANVGTLTYGERYGESTTTGGVEFEGMAFGDNRLSIYFKNGAAGNTLTVPMTVSSTNYQDAAFNVVITLTDKDSQEELTITSANTATYRMSLQLTAAPAAAL